MRNIRPRMIRKITLITGVGGLIIIMLGEYLYSANIMKQIGTGIVFVAVLIHVILYRCPHCHRFLSRSTGKYCPYCGRDMDEDD